MPVDWGSYELVVTGSDGAESSLRFDAGWGVAATHLGAYAQRARVKGDWLVPLPQGLSPAQAMAIGTAGYTAMLCLMALDHHGATPSQGPVLVTGASGGVGSVAVALLAQAQVEEGDQQGDAGD